jgi:endonuclease YncB( thermonuclease family)
VNVLIFSAKIVAALLAGVSLFSSAALGEPIASSRIHVLDGDTIRIDQHKPDVRLVNFNAPETWRAKCRTERALGYVAARRLRELVQAGQLKFELVACSCEPGTEGTEDCNYGRRCGTLTSGGQDVGDILIAEKLAVPFICQETSCPKTPRPWCDNQ